MSDQTQTNLLPVDELLEYQYEPAPKSSRFVNNFIDRIVAVTLACSVGATLSGISSLFSGSTTTNGFIILLAVLTIPGYYIGLEWKLGKTVGKMATKTRVINEHGGPISLGQAVGRFVCRIIPFDAFVALFSSSGRALHDSIPNTWVVKELPVAPMQLRSQQSEAAE